MSAILIPLSSESGRIPYDVRLETFLEEFSEILKEKNMTIITLQEKLTKVENERELLKLASQNLAHNISAKSAVNENIKQTNYHSNGNANLEIGIQGVSDLNKENNSQTDSIRNELSTPTTWYEPSKTSVSKHHKQKICHAFLKTESEENVGVQSSTLKKTGKASTNVVASGWMLYPWSICQMINNANSHRESILILLMFMHAPRPSKFIL